MTKKYCSDCIYFIRHAGWAMNPLVGEMQPQMACARPQFAYAFMDMITATSPPHIKNAKNDCKDYTPNVTAKAFLEAN